MDQSFSKKQKPPKISDIVSPDKKREQIIELEPKTEKEKLEGLENSRESSEGEFFVLKESPHSSAAHIKKVKLSLFRNKMIGFLKKTAESFGGILRVGWKSAHFRPGKTWIFVVPTTVLAAGGLTLFFVLPRVEVVIWPKTENLTFEISAEAQKDLTALDLNNNKIPAELFTKTKEISQSFPSSGKKTVERKAQGVITIYNSYSSSPQTLVKNTRLMSENGRLFRTIETVTIPGATIEEGRIISSDFDVKAIADGPGEDYNIGSATFSIPGFQGTPKYTAFYGKSKANMAGGFRGEVPAITSQDLDAALKQLSSGAKEITEKELKDKIPPTLKLLDDSQETKIVELQKPEIGEEKSEFNITLRVISRIVVFQEEHIKKLINQKILAKFIPSEKEAPADSLSIQYSLNRFPDFEKGVLDIKVKISAKVFWKIDDSFFKNNLAGKDEAGIKDFLSTNQAVERAQVSLWPFWVKKAPTNPEKIKIRVAVPE